MKYAIQNKENGQVIDYCDTLSDVNIWTERYDLDVVDTTSASVIKVIYTELGGPYGYGHQEESFVTYGGITRCVINLYKWFLQSAHVFGPDIRDIKDFFKGCNVYVNGQNKTDWFQNIKDRITKNMIF